MVDKIDTPSDSNLLFEEFETAQPLFKKQQPRRRFMMMFGLLTLVGVSGYFLIANDQNNHPDGGPVEMITELWTGMETIEIKKKSFTDRIPHHLRLSNQLAAERAGMTLEEWLNSSQTIKRKL
ncbi:hypothetical protein [uncultured Rubinisphaera sp.]|uniref:hypothetical protein n=1 Tax=uncultured Rubinisphaera sp. TaxID=1678686 RepID=UPI0030D8E24A